MKQTDATATAPRSRRAILAAAAGAAAASAAATLSRPLQAAAANGDPLILGQGNSAADPTQLQGTLSVFIIDDANPARAAIEATDNSVEGLIAFEALTFNGTAILANTDGGAAVAAFANHPAGVAVAASNAELGTALRVVGKANFLTRSGRATIAAGRASVDIDLRQKGGLTGTPLCFANLMSDRPGVFVRTFRPNYPVAGKARIYLNRTASSNAYVAWFVLN